MTCLDATFTLTPRSPYAQVSSIDWAALWCFGADFTYGNPTDFSSLYTSDRFYFNGYFAADANLDYSVPANRRKARFLELSFDLRGYGTQKQLALIFGFDSLYAGIDGRVLIYSDSGLLKDQTLASGDNQFLLEIESLDQPLSLYFIHAGGYWLFRGISGYVV